MKEAYVLKTFASVTVDASGEYSSTEYRDVAVTFDKAVAEKWDSQSADNCYEKVPVADASTNLYAL